jgi:hypothetical protein
MTSKYEVPDAWDIFAHDEGWGWAVNAGFRELGWSVGGSAMVRRRPLEEGADTETFSLYGVWNPWFYWKSVPLTFQGEVDLGSYQSKSGRDADHLVYYGEVDWTARNGLNFLLAYDWADPDRDVVDDHAGRLQVGAQIAIYPGVSVDARARGLLLPGGGDGADVFTQLHIWF